MNHFLSSCDPHSAALFSEPDTIQSFPRLQNEATKMQDILFVWPKCSLTVRAVPRQVISKTQILNKYRLLDKRLTWHWGHGRSRRTLQHQCSKTVLSRNIPNACDSTNRCNGKVSSLEKVKSHTCDGSLISLDTRKTLAEVLHHINELFHQTMRL